MRKYKKMWIGYVCKNVEKDKKNQDNIQNATTSK